jgi:uncharacterized damage-inducible protein DinB
MANEIFIIQFEFIYKALSLNIENITHQESMMFPEAGGNCMNWMLGHILDYRNRMLAILNQEPIWNKETISCYKRGTNTAVEKDNFLQWQQLLNYISHTQILILKTLKEEEINEPDKIKSFAQLLAHESYHTGQIGLLRRVLGKEGQLK